MDTRVKKGLLLAFGTAIISGVSIFANSYGVKGFDSSVFTFSKNVVVALLLFSVILAFGQFHKLKELTIKQWLQLTGIGLVGGSIPFLLFFRGLQLTTGTTSAFIHKTLFVWIGVMALLFLKEKLNVGFILGAAALLLGNYFFLRPTFGFELGHLLILAATLFWAFENVWSKHVVASTSGTVVAFGRMFFGSLFILVFLAFTGKLQIVGSMSLAQYGWIGVTSVFLLLYVLTYYNALSFIKVSTAASILAIGSPITTTLAWIVQGKAVVPAQFVGMFLIAAGIVSIIWYAQIVKGMKFVWEKVTPSGWN